MINNSWQGTGTCQIWYWGRPQDLHRAYKLFGEELMVNRSNCEVSAFEEKDDDRR
jgi:hypothetical protein